MDRVTALFVEGMGAAAATSGVLTQLQGRIFGLLYMCEGTLSLDEITDELQQSKSNVSVQVRGLVDWQLVHQVRVPGSRKDHYEAATDFWRVLQEILERRFRWNLRQVIAAADETERALTAEGESGSRDATRARLAALRDYMQAVDAGMSAFSRGEAWTPAQVRTAPPRRIPVTSANDLR